MSTLKATNLQHKDSSDPNVVLYADGSTSIRNLQNLDSNVIINGAMVVDQRYDGASQNSDGRGFLGPDRWIFNYDTASTFTAQQVSDAPVGFTKSFQINSAAATTPAAAQSYVVQQRIEGQNIAKFAFGTANAKTLTLSFWVKASQAGDYSVALTNMANNRSYVTTFNVSSASTWEPKSIVISGDTAGAWVNTSAASMVLKFPLAAGSNFETSTDGSWQAANRLKIAGTNDVLAANGRTFQFTGVQLTATDAPIEFQHEGFEATLDKCRRYYQKYEFTNVQFQRICLVAGTGGTNGVALFTLAKPLRTNIATSGFSSSPANSFRINGLADPSDRAISSIAVSSNHGKADYVIGLDIGFQNNRPAGSACYLSRENLASPCFLAFEAEL